MGLSIKKGDTVRVISGLQDPHPVPAPVALPTPSTSAAPHAAIAASVTA